MWKKCAAWALTAAMALTLCASCGAGAVRQADLPGQETAPSVPELAELQSPMLPVPYAPVMEPFYADVAEDRWYHPYVRTLYDAGVLPGGELFEPKESASRMDFVLSLYRMHLALGGAAADGSGSPFEDVPAGGDESAAAVWAWQKGVTQGVTATAFGPETALSREQGCTFAVRFAAAEGLRLARTAEAELFPDSGRVSKYARSAMAACQMAGILSGANGRAEPRRELTRAEAAAILCRLWEAANREIGEAEECVLLDAEAYLELYRLAYVFGDPIPESDPVDPSWFANAAFVGDSITVGLSLYNTALKDATFLCTTSLSAPAALGKVSEKSKHPAYNGRKMRVEDAVAVCGAKNVYILLGINNMYSALETSTSALNELIEKIAEKNPGVNIIVQSVTPLTATSTILSENMNNWKIDQYNAIMRKYCAEHSWYYLDVASAVKDANGDFDPGCCGDAKRMGIHFSANGVKVWENYLFTHVPEALK